MAGSSTILRGTVRSNKANRQLKFIIGGVIVVALIAYLMVNAIQSAGTYYREVHEVLAQQTALTGKRLRLGEAGSAVQDLRSDQRQRAARYPLPWRATGPDVDRGLERHSRGNSRHEWRGGRKQLAAEMPVAL
jgi:hypothetical protein